MKMKFVLSIIALLTFLSAKAQEYKLAKSSGTLNINEVNHVSIEGTTGSEIIFTTKDTGRGDDDRARGLRSISSLGLEDNTGLGLSVIEKEGAIEVSQLKKMGGPEITIKVPKGVKVFVTHSSPHGGGIEVQNFEGELSVSTVHNSVRLINVTGSQNVKTMHGDIEASLPVIKSPVNISSLHGHVDVAIPVSTKANLRIETQWGEILVDPDFKIEIERTGDMVKYSDKVSGKLNGGGIDVNLSSMHNNIYLRKK